MTINHHPCDESLVAYASGAADEATSLLIATHLTLCPACRRSVRDAESVGGTLLEDIAPEAMSADAFARVASRLGSAPQAEKSSRPSKAPAVANVSPKPLRDYLGGDLDSVRWRRIAPGVETRAVGLTGGKGRARLIRIAPGHAIPEHGHNGEELTLVLTGGYTDESGHFLRGDVEQADSGVEHQPVADPGGPCVVLATTDAPLRFKSRLAGVVGRILGI